jgi:hypothetical protein
MAIDDNGHAELLDELRDVRRDHIRKGFLIENGVVNILPSGDRTDRQAIWRATPECPSIPGKAKGSTYVWFSRRLGLLFWDRSWLLSASNPAFPPASRLRARSKRLRGD